MGGGKSMLANIGASLQASPYYERRLDEYLLQCPVMVQYGPIVKGYLTDMSEFEGNAEETQKLWEMAKQLPKMVHQLRAGSCVEVVETFKRKLAENFEKMAADIDTCEGTQMRTMSETLKEASIMFPMECEWQEKLDKCTSFLQKIGENEVLKNLMKLAQELVDSDVAAKDTCEKLYTKFTAELEGMSFHDQLLSTAELAVMAAVCSKVFDVMDKHWDLDKAPSAVVRSSLTCGKLLQPALSDSSLQKALLVVSEGMPLAEALHEYKDETLLHNAPNNADGLFQSLVKLQRRLTKFHDVAVDLPEDSHTFLTKLTTWADGVKNMAKEKQSTMLASQKQTLNNSHTKLVDIMGQYWMDGFSGTTWEDMTKHASETIMKVDGQQLVLLHSQLSQACSVGPSQKCQDTLYDSNFPNTPEW
eukprot:3311589-Amphidinium_carterae.5